MQLMGLSGVRQSSCFVDVWKRITTIDLEVSCNC